jgi:hypothetical protein
MEFAKQLFELENGKNFSLTDCQDPIKILYNQLNLLEDYQSSPLPNLVSDKIQLKYYISNCLIKIIISLDFILTDKLFYNTSSRNESNHYWNLLLRHFGNKDSVKFIQYHMLENINLQQKGLAWLCIDILDKDLHSFFLDFYKIGITR